MKYVSKSKKAFTLIELVVTMSIMLILSGIAIPKYIGYRDKAKVTKAINTARQIYTAVMYSYSEQGGSFNKTSMLDTINTVTPIDNLVESSIILVDSKNTNLNFTSDEVNYVLQINADSNMFNVKSNNSLIYNGS